MRLIGAVLIVLAGLAAGIMKARSLNELDRTYTALISALGLIKSEISSRSAPLDEVMRTTSGASSGAAGSFIKKVSADFSRLGEETFRDIWSGAAALCLRELPPRAMASVKALGGSLGRYDSVMQCAALDCCMTDIAAEREALRAALCEDKRMYVGLGGAVGLILAIVLI